MLIFLFTFYEDVHSFYLNAAVYIMISVALTVKALKYSLVLVYRTIWNIRNEIILAKLKYNMELNWEIGSKLSFIEFFSNSVKKLICKFHDFRMAMYKGHPGMGGHGKPVPAPRQASSPMSPTMYAEMNRPLPSQIMAAAAAGMSVSQQTGASMSDAKAKTVLKEAVDAVVNSFAKHSHGYGRGNYFIYM